MEGSRHSKKRFALGEDHQALIKTTHNNERSTSEDTDKYEEKIPRGNKFAIDYSKNGKAKCKECGSAIPKGELRIGKNVSFKDTYILQYHHLSCAFTSFKRARVLSSVISASSEIDGFENISSEEKLMVEDLIAQSNAGRANPLPEEMSHKKAKTKMCHSQKTQIRSLKPSNMPSMKVLFTNADQLTSSKMAELQIKVNQEKPHIVAVSEVKPKNRGKERTMEDYKISGYSLHPTNLDENAGRGIAVYTHSSIDKSVTQITLNQSFEEACSIEVRLRGGDVLLFCCCYRSPTTTVSSAVNNEYLNRLLQTISKKNYTHRCIVGDFNFRDINWTSLLTHCGEQSAESKFIEAVRDSFLHQHVTEVTRSRGNDTPSTLDLIFTDEEMQVSNIQYHSPLGKSDHSVILFDYHCYLDYSKPKETFIYSKGDYNSMREDVYNSGWLPSYLSAIENAEQSIEESWSSLKTELHRLRGKYIPRFTPSGKPTWNERGTFPVSKSTREAIQLKKKYHRLWISEQGTGDAAIARLRFCQSRNKVKQCVRRDKRNFERGIAMQSKKNPKAFWSHARRKLKTKRGVAPLFVDVRKKDSLKFGDKDKAEILQRQFSSVYTEEPAGEIPTFQERCNSRILFPKLSAESVKKKLSNLNPDKSIGPDDIHAKLLVELAEPLSEPLSVLFNETIRRGELPSDWKQAYISSIFKKGSRNHAENYRPISLTSIICKVMESFIRDAVLEHMTRHNLLSCKQHGFIAGRSTVTQLLVYLDKCAEMIAKGKVVDSIYLDFQKAFDTVPHRRLIGKLEAYGITGSTLEWIREYLNGRTQTVVVNGEKSAEAPVMSGIPQGTVLGPLLFVVYINDLLDNISSNGLLYADDTKIFRQISSKKDAEELQLDIMKLEEWAKTWLLKFHPDKCHVLSLGKIENTKHTHRYRICEQEMEHVYEEKDLGVVFDSEMSFREHIANQINKANSITGLIRRAFTFLDCESFTKLYCALVRTHLEYGQAIWSPHLMRDLDAIENVQMRATKLVDGLSNLTYSERLQKLNLPTLKYRRLRGDIIEMYKHVHTYDADIVAPSFLRRFRPSRQHEYQIHEPVPKDGIRGVQANSFHYRIPRIWNNLPRQVVEANNLDTFKSRLDKLWSNQPMKYDHRATLQIDL